MTDEEYEREKARVQRLIDKWPKMLGLGWYEITYCWEREKCSDDEARSSIVMATNTQWEYRWATINIYLPSLPESEKALERDFVHELCHILMAPEQRQLKTKKHGQYVEAATANVTQAMIWLYEDIAAERDEAIKRAGGC